MEQSIKKNNEVQTLLKFTYGLIPIAAGADKFTNLLTNWANYLNPSIKSAIPVSDHTFMCIVGDIEIIAGILVFINPQKNNPVIVQAYNNLLNNICFTNIPVIYTLSEDDVYLITRKRTTFKSKRSLIADNITDAIKKALYIQPYHSKSHNKHIKTIPFPSYIASA